MKILFSNSFNIITFSLFIVVATTSAQNTKCPFQFLYQFGDGITDTGNSVRVIPFGPLLPPTRYPYGKTFPGFPNGRWSDGLLALDYGAQAFGLPNIKRYLSLDISTSDDGVVFSVEGSTITDTSLFNAGGVRVPPYNIPLNTQVNWFRNYVNSITCTNQIVCSNRRHPSNSLVIFENSEANDMGYALEQGRPMEEVASYVPLIVQTQVNAAREVIKLGAKKIIYSLAGPLGCYPYILTALVSTDPTAYDELGCSKAVNNLTMSMNAALQTAFNGLKAEFPTVVILGADFYTAITTVINQTSVLGSNGNPALTSCCGIGGRYNYDKNRFCGSFNVPVCPNPNNYVYWDGLHFTQEAHRRIINLLLKEALPLLNCTST